MSSPPIQWYPGHIAKAQQQLQDQLQRVDVVLEVIDARIPWSSRHPDLKTWMGTKARLLVLNKMDCISPEAVKAWCQWFQGQGVSIFPTQGQSGHGIASLKQAALDLGQSVNERRHKRGMKPRPIRAAVVGFPNVGKSAILNRLMGRRVVDSAARPGVTRQLRWVRLGQRLDLLDAPGIIPPVLNDQAAAVKLAICDDIGQASYTPDLIAADFLDLLKQIYPQAQSVLDQRYGLSEVTDPGSVLLAHIADLRYQGNQQRAAQQLLNDYRKGLLGPISLELPPGLVTVP